MIDHDLRRHGSRRELLCRRVAAFFGNPVQIGLVEQRLLVIFMAERCDIARMNVLDTCMAMSVDKFSTSSRKCVVIQPGSLPRLS